MDVIELIYAFQGLVIITVLAALTTAVRRHLQLRKVKQILGQMSIVNSGGVVLAGEDHEKFLEKIRNQLVKVRLKQLLIERLERDYRQNGVIQISETSLPSSEDDLN